MNNMNLPSGNVAAGSGLGTPILNAGAPTSGTNCVQTITPSGSPTGGTYDLRCGTNSTNGITTQTVTVVGSPTGGTFRLQVQSYVTGPIAYGAAASGVQTALRALPNCANLSVSGSAGGPFTVIGPIVSVADTSLTGGSSPSVTVVGTTGIPYNATKAQLQAILQNIPFCDGVVVTGTDTTGPYTLTWAAGESDTAPPQVTLAANNLTGGSSPTVTCATTTITVTGSPTGGTFALGKSDGRNTGPIVYNATAATLLAALQGLFPHDVGITCSGNAGGPWTITNIPAVMLYATGLDGGSSPSVTISSNITAGAAATGRGTAIGGLLIDIVNAVLYQNTGTQTAPSWSAVGTMTAGYFFVNAGAPTNGTGGTQNGSANPGALLIDTTNKRTYQNTGTKASPTWSPIQVAVTASSLVDDTGFGPFTTNATPTSTTLAGVALPGALLNDTANAMTWVNVGTNATPSWYPIVPLMKAGAPANGTVGTGTFAGVAPPASVLIDTSNFGEYMNTGTLASPVWTKIKSLA